jgi:hypothetical protein
MSRKLLYKDVKVYIEGEDGNGCKLKSEKYINQRKKLEIQCKCGNSFNCSFDDFKNAGVKRCKECSSQKGKSLKRWNYKEVKQFIEIDSNSGCKLISDYKMVKDNIIVKCACGNPFEVTFQNFYRRNKRKCNNCSIMIRNDKLKLTYEYIKNFIEKESESECLLLNTVYEDSKTKLSLKCKCGIDFQCDWNDFYNRNQRQCSQCGYNNGGIKRRRVYDEIKYYIEVESDSNCKLISDTFNGVHRDLIIQCECGHSFKTNFVSFCEGKHHCSLCVNISSGETSIEKFLIRNNMPYNSQYIFKDCKYKRPLPFDFAVLDNNQNLKCLIEFDGKHHFLENSMFDSDLALVQKKDKIKTDYCFKNNISLIRIPYWKGSKINQTLTEELYKFNII